jgi:hypothetical protein
MILMRPGAYGRWLAGIAWITCGVSSMVSASVSAADPALVVSPPEYSGDIPKHLRNDIDAAVLEALGELAIEPIDARREFNCKTSACALREAREAKLEHVIVVSIDADDRDFQIVVEARAASDGRVQFKNEELCDLCGHHELLAVVTAQVRALAGLVNRGKEPPMLLISGSPSDAAVTLDGELVGRTPLEIRVEPGPHLVELHAPGYAGQSHRFQAKTGIQEIIDFKLSKARVNRRGAQVGGWIGFATGVAGLGLGGALIAIDGEEHDPTCPPELRDANGVCPNVYTTQVAGIVTASIGGAALVTGVSLLVHAARKNGGKNADKRKDRANVEIEPRPGGFLLRF